VAGAVITVVGDLIDPSKFSNLDVGRLAIDKELPATFAVRHVFGFSIDPVPTYTWAAGIILAGIGLFILSVDTEDRTWGRASALLGIAYGAMAFTNINVFGTKGIFLDCWLDHHGDSSTGLGFLSG
jgi:hypothetical protein